MTGLVKKIRLALLLLLGVITIDLAINWVKKSSAGIPASSGDRWLLAAMLVVTVLTSWWAYKGNKNQ